MKYKAVIAVILISGISAAGLYLNQENLTVSNMSPSSEIIEDDSAELQFTVDSGSDFEYEVILDNRTVENLSLLAGQGDSLTVDTGVLAPGTHRWKVNVSTDGKQVSSETHTFQTSEEPEFEEPRFISVKSVEFNGETVDFQIVNAGRANYTAYVNGREAKSGELQDLGLSPHNTIQIDVSDIEGPRNVYVEASRDGVSYETLVWPIIN
jgi:hypothetical protein